METTSSNTSMRTVFISHSSKDKQFAQKLALDLRGLGIGIWFDQWEIKVGDSIIEKISHGLKENDFLAIVLSPDSVNSEWVKRELNSVLSREIAERKVSVLPILHKTCDIPALLRDKKYADFTGNYEDGLTELLAAILPDSFSDAADLNRQLSDHYVKLAIACESGGNLAEAAAHYERAIRVCPSNAEAYYNFGVLRTLSGQQQEAIKQYLKTLELNPRHISALVNLGVEYLDLNETQSAIKTFQTAVSFGAKDYACFQQLGKAYLMSHQFQEAVEPLLNAAALAPNLEQFALVMYYLSGAYRGLGNLGYYLAYLEEFVLTKEKLSAKDVPFDVYTWLIDGFIQLGDIDKALEFFKKAVSIYGYDERLKGLETQINAVEQFLRQSGARTAITSKRLDYENCKSDLLRGRTMSFAEIKEVAGKTVLIVPRSRNPK